MCRFALLLLVIAGCSGGSAPAPSQSPVTIDTFFERAQDRIAEGDTDGAIDDLTEVISRNPEHVDAFTIRGALHSKRGEYREALTDLEHAVELDPSSPMLANDLAWLLATCPDGECRNGKRAVELAKLAILNSNESWQYGDALAAALAESGDFQEAIRALELAMADAPAGNKLELQRRMVSYQERKPWRE